MYLSCLLIDLGNNPDRPRPGRMWLRNRYHVHQRLCMAFPSATRKTEDLDFLKPFNPDDFCTKQIQVTRDCDAGFLFRIDPLPNGRATILVQSAIQPDWDYAFHNASHFLASSPEVKQFESRVINGQRFKFRLVANPTRRLSERSLGPDGKAIEKGIGKRVPVPDDRLCDWLERRAQSAGFFLHKESIIVQPGYVYLNKDRNGSGKRLRSVRYDGVLTVEDAVQFKETLIKGIGSGKAFGFGLLSIAPALSSCTETSA